MGKNKAPWKFSPYFATSNDTTGWYGGVQTENSSSFRYHCKMWMDFGHRKLNDLAWTKIDFPLQLISTPEIWSFMRCCLIRNRFNIFSLLKLGWFGVEMMKLMLSKKSVIWASLQLPVSPHWNVFSAAVTCTISGGCRSEIIAHVKKYVL